uniref:Interleukin-2 receptor subunit beta N-terminal domain-containing protein n=1 Tax=Oryzias melastigma TaxID=30732 RepID=A0A3B3D440_ORYME
QLLHTAALQSLYPFSEPHPPCLCQGLQCTNDYVNNVSCVWSHSGEDCWILGVKKIWDQGNSQLLIKWENSPPGCSFVFEDQLFSGSEVLPRISVKCNDTFVENLTDYKLSHHIKMQRPSAPNVSSSANGTRVWWRLEGRISFMFRSRFKFELQRKKSSESWEAETNTVTEKELLLPDLSGPWQLRVRVLPFKRKTSQWSDWSPTTSWMGGTETEDTVLKALPEPNAQGRSPVITLYSELTSDCCCSVLKVKPVPNPSKYFNTLHSVHKGDLKKWLNPLSLSEAIFTAPLCDLISPVEVCEDWVELPSSSSSSTRGLLSNQSCRSLGSNASGFAYHSSSLSNYCNMGYFMSNSSNASAGTDPNAAYFTFPDNFRPQPFLASASSYESLTKEPNSPDSGIGFIKESEDTNRRHVEVKEDDCSPFLLFVQHPSPRIFTSSMPPALPHPDPATQTGSVCRSSSMPVETCRSGYLTLKELQATFSNKSI